jgi:hypothetical protein
MMVNSIVMFDRIGDSIECDKVVVDDRFGIKFYTAIN